MEMKKKPPRFSFVSFALFVGVLFAAPLKALGPPAIFSPNAESDFGERPSGDQLTHTFILRNTGGSLLEIRNVRVSCGCTGSHLSKNTLAPGDEATLTVRLDLSGRSGPQNHYVTVHSNDPRQPQYSLNLRGVAVPKFNVTPRTLNFQRIDPASPPNGVIRVEATGDHTLAIQGVTTTQDRLEVRLETLEEHKTYEIHVTPREPLGEGNFSDVVQIETDDPENAMVRAIVMWQIQPPVNVAPGQLSLVVPRNPAPVNRILLVRAHDENAEHLEVLDVEWPGREMDVHASTTGHGRWRIELRGIVPEMSMNREEILIRTNLEGHEVLRVPVRTVRQ